MIQSTSGSAARADLWWRRLFGLAAALLATCTVAKPQGRLVVDQVDSESLRNTLTGESSIRKVAVYLPPSYEIKTERHYPVLYLLHGIGGTHRDWTGSGAKRDNWRTIQDVLNQEIAAGRIEEMIVVAPDQRTRGGGSFYTNSAATGNWEDFTVVDLVAHVDASYRTLDHAASRGIAGHSMGGYGAIMLGMKHPGVFQVVYAMNPALLGWAGDITADNRAYERAAVATPGSLDPKRDFYVPSLLCVAQAFSPNADRPPFFADLPFEIREGQLQKASAAHERWTQAMPLYLAEEYRDNLGELEALRFDAATYDLYTHITPTSRALSEKLTRLAVPHTFEEYNGDHRNRLWGRDGRIATVVLPYFSRELAFEPAATASAGSSDQSAAAELHEFYGTLTFEGGRQITGGPAIKPKQMIYIDTGGDAEAFMLQVTGDDTMVSADDSFRVRWIRDADRRLVEAEFTYDDGQVARARFVGTCSEPIEVKSEGARIRGRLHLPQGDGPHPALVLIHGSGDNSRRWGTFVTFFVDLGLAVVAFDKRGVEGSEGDWRDGSYELLAEDAARFVDALGERADIDRDRIGLLGHSEGGWVAPITAAKRKHVAFVMSRVGPAIPSPEVNRYGLRMVGVKRGKDGKEQVAWERMAGIFADAQIAGISFDAMLKNLDPLRESGWMSKWSASDTLLEAYRPSWEFRLRNAKHDPATYLSELHAPVLWFMGETDMNVETATTVAALNRALAEHLDATVVVLPGIDHTFLVKGDGGAVHYAPGFWGPIKEWLTRRDLVGGGSGR